MSISASVGASRSQPAAVVSTAPPIRLRFVFLLGMLAWGVLSLYPRMQAAFRLHDLAVATANYGLCMVGPTGPTLIRDRPLEFQKLVRRRLVASEAGERPFQRCAKLARKVSDDFDVERLHTLTAAEFREHSGRGVSLSGLAVSAAPLAQLFHDAWPFARGGYTQLVRPSLGAAEAAHVPAPARPVAGRGLPAVAGIYRNVWRDGSGFGLALGSGSDTGMYVTADRGLTFRAVGRHGDAYETHAERCASLDGRKIYRLTPREDGGAQQVLFNLEGGQASTSDLGPINERILGTGCDERSLVALTAEGQRLRLRACPFGGRCGELPLPKLLHGGAPQAADIAKVKGTIVLSLATDGVVRVVSSRDEGRSFTPPVVAFDAAEYPELGLRRPPARLLGLGDRLLLYAGGAKSTDTYPLLVSDDQGVSFRAP